jgi:hypothetical protein
VDLTLDLLEGTFAVCRLAPEAPVPGWASSSRFVSVTRTGDELSVVCPQEAVPAGVVCEPDWRCLRIAGKLEFHLVGVLASLLVPLAEAGVSVFVLSTFDTDYLLVKAVDLERALEVLRRRDPTEDLP